MVTYTTKRPLLVKWYMDFFGYKGLATVWNTIYFKDVESMNNQRLLKHELKHIEQMERDGKVKWLIRYYYYWIRYGYINNPYEIEARQAEK